VNWTEHEASTEGHFQVTGSHVHCKSGNILETVQDRDVVPTSTDR